MISPVVAFPPKERVFTVPPPDLDSTIIDQFIEASEVLCVYNFTKGFGNDGRLVQYLYTSPEFIIYTKLSWNMEHREEEVNVVLFMSLLSTQSVW